MLRKRKLLQKEVRTSPGHYLISVTNRIAGVGFKEEKTEVRRGERTCTVPQPVSGDAKTGTQCPGLCSFSGSLCPLGDAALAQGIRTHSAKQSFVCSQHGTKYCDSSVYQLHIYESCIFLLHHEI